MYLSRDVRDYLKERGCEECSKLLSQVEDFKNEVFDLRDIIEMLDADIECLKQDFTEEHIKNERLRKYNEYGDRITGEA